MSEPERTLRELLGLAPRLHWVQYCKNILPEKPEKLILCQQAKPGDPVRRNRTEQSTVAA